MPVLRRCVALALSLTLLLAHAGANAQAALARVSPDLLRALASEERGTPPTERVIVSFETPGSRDVVPQPAQVRSAREQVLARLPVGSFEQVASFDRIRAVSLKINSNSLEILRRTPGVVAINRDRVVRKTMVEANAVTNVALLHASGYTGDGQVVAIIDTGVDSNAGVVHPALADDLVGQACFRTENDCIGGATSAEDQDGHGTHVAGIITGPQGVAPDAQFHALKVFTTGDTSDTNILNALNHIIGLNMTTPGAVDLVNMSLGGGNYATNAACDADGAAYVSAFATLNGQGTAVFVATGNDAETDMVGSPACITGAIGVGSTGDASFSLSFGSCTDNGAPDKVSCYSNATPVQGAGELVDLLAPGCLITSTGLNGSVAEDKCGTSMATPYAAGSAAVVLEFLQGRGLVYTPAQLEDVLEFTGKPVLDYRIPASPQYPRVDPVATVGALSFAAPPSGFTITGTTSTSISMSWTGVPEATEYRIYRNVPGAPAVQVGSVTVPTVSFTDSGVICGPQTYFVRAWDGSSLSLPSNEDTGTARDCPLAPSSLVATPVSSTAVTLDWSDANPDETSQILQRRLNSGAFADYQTLPAGSSFSHPETALPCGVYQYRAVAERNGDRSAPSNVVQFAACAPANDNFVNAENVVADVTITDVEANVSFASEESADPDYSCKFGGAGPGFQGLWYRITPTVATRVTVSTAATTIFAPSAGVPDTLAAIYTHDGSAFTQIACNDDISGSNFRSSVSSNLAAGTTYYVFVSQWVQVPPGTVGNLSVAFTWSAPPVVPDNDLVANARVIGAMPYNNTVTAAQNATVSATDLPHSCSILGPRIGTHTLWWTFTPATNGLLDIDTLASSGSFTDTIMTVYSGNPGSFTAVACNDDEPAPGATLRSEILDLALTAGTQYTIYVSRWSNTPTASAGTVVLNASFQPTAGPPAQLAIGTQPGNTAAGAAITPAITVNILDAAGVQTTSNADVTLAIGTNPGSGTLAGTTTVAAVNGVATFSNLSIDKAGTGYTLAASSVGLTGDTSDPFNITAAAASQLAFLQQPSNGVPGAVIAPPVSVRILDAFGNQTASTASVDIALGANPGAGTLGGTASVAAVAGVASFPNLSIDNAGNGYTLTAASAGLAGATSSAFNINCPATVVTNGNDSGAGSLRQIIADACVGSTITFAGGVTSVGLTTAQLLINKNLTIDGGAGVTVTRVAGSPNFRIFSIAASSTVTLDSLTINNGSTTGVGGGVFSAGTLTLRNSTVTGNSAGTNFGGGLWTQGPTVIDGCTISGNQAGNGGGLSHGFNTLTMSNTTVSDNTTAFQASGVNIQDATAILVNCTISGNRSNSSQAGIAHFVFSRPASSLELINCTVTDNVGAAQGFGGVWTAYGPDTPGQTVVTRLENTLVASNFPENFTTTTGTADTRIPTPNAFLASLGHNLDSDGTSGFVNGSNGDLVGTVATPINALLAPLGTFGGPTETHALLPGSPAMNAGNNAACAAVPVGNLDQRGVARPQQTACDIGAYESRGFTLAVTGGNNQSQGPGLIFASTLSVSATPVAPGEPVNGGVVTFTPPGAGASAGLSPNPATISGGSASSTATANATVGSYSVSANAIGASAPVSFTLTNAGAELSIDDVSLTEGDAGTSNAVFTLTRTNNLTDFIVPYSVTPGSAQAGSDYMTTSGTMQFVAGGPLTRTISVPIVGDLIVEATETATLSLSAPINIVGVTTLADGSGLLTISDNDSAVVAFNPVSVSQTEATTPMAFTVTLSNPVQSGVMLTLNSAPGTATVADFTIVGGTVSFAPNSNTSQTVNVAINNDALDEDDETFTLTLSALTAVGNVTPGTLVATGTILDDDLPPVISISNPSQPEGNGGLTPMSFQVSLSAASGRDVSFTRATADGSATVGNNDYQPLAPTLITIPAGQLGTTLAVQIVGDTAFEGNESFSVDLSNIVNATVAASPLIEGSPASLSGTGTILEDDQQPTTTTITSDLPDPSVVGQPYTVSVTVAAQTLSPSGTVTISDGSASCGPVTLTAGTAPNATASCALTSTTAGAKTLTASYTAATTAFGDSSGTTSHQVDPASTSISVTGPTRSRINQPTSFSFALSVNAPGAGTPTGTVTLSSGSASCTATLPATACDLSFDALGNRTVSASYAGDGNFSGSSSSGPGNAQTLVYALSDLSLTKSDGVPTYEPGDLLVYSVIVRNLGPDAAAIIRITDAIPAGLIDVTWTCDASGGVACPVTGGTGNLDVTIASFPVGGLLNFTFYGNVDGSPASIANTAAITLPADTTIEDPVLGNNSATDTDLLDGLFANGFEDPQVNAPTGSVRIPAIVLGRTLGDDATIVLRLTDANGEAVRVYARLHEAAIQYAVARRASNGRLRLGAWTALPGEPTLSWTARQASNGWVVETVELR
ncbi:MAG: S8 family serine peptidase [Rhodanobacteraceae bacterium]|nr:S8 family serine peptidase [Rhodanobacteraceae bacterium]